MHNKKGSFNLMGGVLILLLTIPLIYAGAYGVGSYGLGVHGVGEVSASSENGGGGGSSSISLICTLGTIQCIDSLHYQECLKFGLRNKWSDVLSVQEGYHCLAGKVIELEETKIKKGEVVDEIPEITEEVSAEKPSEKETEESKTSLMVQTGKRIKQFLVEFNKLWLIPIFTAVLTTIIVSYLLKKKKKE